MGIASYFYQAYHQMIKENIRKAREVSDMTRFEKIQNMKTADKLADWLMQYMDCDACPVMDCKSFKYCKRNLTKFLNSEEPKMCASCAINFGDGERTEHGKID